MFGKRIEAYLKSVFVLKKVHLSGIPLIPKGLFRNAPYNRTAYNSFLIEAKAWNLGPEPLIYDIGANNGDFSLAFRKIYPDATIVAFEPLKSLASRLHSLNRSVGLGLQIFDCALGGSNETLVIEVPEGQAAASSLHGFGDEYLKHNPGASNTIPQEVTVRRLDGISELATSRRIDLMKIDVEGFEFEVIRGAGEVLHRVNNMVVEVSRLRHENEETCAIMRMVREVANYGLSLHRIEPTIINENLSRFPLEFDLYFSRMR